MENYPEGGNGDLTAAVRSLESRMSALEERVRGLGRPSQPTRINGSDGHLHVSRYGGYSVEFEREFNESIEEVWRTMTDPSRLIDWYGEAEIDAREGGKMETRFANSGAVASSIITEYDPPGVFEQMWVTGRSVDPAQPMPDAMARAGGTCGDLSLAASVIRYELTTRPEGGTKLNLSHYAPMNPRLIAKPLTRGASRSGSRASETPAPDMVLATWDILLDLLDNALVDPGNRSMSLTNDRRSAGWPWDKFGEVRERYSQLIR